MTFYCETYYYMYYEVFDVIVAFVLHLNNNIISITAGGSCFDEFIECCGQTASTSGCSLFQSVLLFLFLRSVANVEQNTESVGQEYGYNTHRHTHTHTHTHTHEKYCISSSSTCGYYWVLICVHEFMLIL